MAKTDIFQDSTKSIPKSDPRVVRIDFDKNDIGARKSHISGALHKNDYDIKHVKEGRYREWEDALAKEAFDARR